MLKITKNKDEIIIRELPVVQWINSIIVTAILFTLVSIWLASMTDFSGVAWGLGVIAAFAAFLLYMLSYPVTTTKIDNPGKFVSVRRLSLVSYSFKIYSFSEIADSVFIDAPLSGSQNRITKNRQLKLPLKDGTSIELSAVDGSNGAEYLKAIDLMNPYIFDTSKQIPFKLTVFNDD